VSRKLFFYTIYLVMPFVFQAIAMEINNSGQKMLALLVLLVVPFLWLTIGGYFIGRILYPGEVEKPFGFMVIGIFIFVAWVLATTTFLGI